jgi:hypothetical protein
MGDVLKKEDLEGPACGDLTFRYAYSYFPR